MEQRGRATITSGVVGNVWEWTCRGITPVSRVIYVYPALPMSAVTRIAGGAYYAEQMPAAPLPIDSARSDSVGFVQFQLPAGTYSFVLKDSVGFLVALPTYAIGYIGLHTVSPGEIVRANFDNESRATW